MVENRKTYVCPLFFFFKIKKKYYVDKAGINLFFNFSKFKSGQTCVFVFTISQSFSKKRLILWTKMVSNLVSHGLNTILYLLPRWRIFL